MPSNTQSYLHLWLFGGPYKYGKNKKGSFKNKIRGFFTRIYKLISNNLIEKEVRTMTKNIKKETTEQPEEKNTEVKSEAKGSCGCGCLPPMKTK